jgi:hypothetical protein
MVNVKLDNLRGVIAPLYHRYSNEEAPQPAFIEIDENGMVRAGTSEEMGDAVPAVVRQGVVIRLSATPTLRGDVIAFLESESARQLLEIIHAGHEVAMIGGNRIGKLSQEATWCWDALQQLMDGLDGDAANHLSLEELTRLDPELVGMCITKIR